MESNAADAKEHVAADVKDSDTEGCYLIKNWITLFRGCHPMLRAVWFGVHEKVSFFFLRSRQLSSLREFEGLPDIKGYF